MIVSPSVKSLFSLSAMEISSAPRRLPSQTNTDDIIKRRLLKKGVIPTPKIIHTLRKKQLQKSLRKSETPLSDQTQDQEQSIAEESYFQTLKAEYKSFNKAINAKTRHNEGVSMIGKPWERLQRVELRELAIVNNEFGGQNLNYEHLEELGEILENEHDKFRWLLDDDIELEDGWADNQRHSLAHVKRRRSDADTIQFLVDRLSGTKLSMKDWKFSRMMKQSGLQFTEGQMLKIVEGLGNKGQWRHALSVVEWVYNSKEHRHFKSRFVYTKLLAVLGKARKPDEALRIFNLMRDDCHIYPDMAAYHSIAVALGQAGFVKELVNVVECMKQKPSRKIKNMRRKNWDPVLQPDLVVYNAVLNACVPSCQWRGVSWVLDQLRKSGLKPNGATYGLAMEVMMRSGKYDLVHEFFGKMKRSGEAPRAITYKVLVKAFWEEGKVNEAVHAVRDMEQKGVVGAACVYYELACCLCNKGRWREAMVEIEKLKRLPRSKPLEVAFTGMILSSLNGGHIDGCLSIFEHSKEHCTSDIGIVNAMLKVYGRNDMFFKAKELFEDAMRANLGSGLNCNNSSLSPDQYTYCLILEASANAHQWEYFDYIYKEMVFSGYQLDQSRHASLLVEASRGGKWHLLEHAFDTILEAGEIPDSSFFCEIVCQAIIRCDFERAVTILNSMAHAPFQVSEKQWMELFEDYGGKINRSNLQQLSDMLCNHDIAMEASVSNLSRLLRSLVGSNSSNLISLSNKSSCESLSDGGNMGSKTGKDFQVNHEEASHLSFVIHPSNGMEDKSDSESEDGGFNGDEEAGQSDNTGRFALDSTCNGPFGSFQDRNSRFQEYEHMDFDDELEFDMLKGELGYSDRPKLPSAEKILENWKESRRKDGIFFPFQLDMK